MAKHTWCYRCSKWKAKGGTINFCEMLWVNLQLLQLPKNLMSQSALTSCVKPRVMKLCHFVRETTAPDICCILYLRLLVRVTECSPFVEFVSWEISQATSSLHCWTGNFGPSVSRIKDWDASGCQRTFEQYCKFDVQFLVEKVVL